jgi:alpha-aminoadipic semialdehyde synthase
MSTIGDRIAREGLPQAITPFICGFAGYGNVFRGANEIVEHLPTEEIAPAEVAAIAQQAQPPRDKLYKVVFKEEHTVEPISPDDEFELQDYYDHPEKYRGRFSDYLPYLNVLVNCVYWEEKYPRLVTKSDVKTLYQGEQPRLRVIGDISCDIEGAIEATIKSTEPGDPVFVYDPIEDRAIDGVAGDGPVIMAVDILPSEIPRDSSIYFSEVLKAYIPDIAQADYSVPFEALDLSPEIKRAVIVYQGELTPDYRYLKQYLE